MHMDEIPFHEPYICGRELDYLREAIDSGKLEGDGPFTQRCAKWLKSRLGSGHHLLTPSCTAALELAAMLCRLGPGDEVIMPSYTFVSTAIAVLRTGAEPVFVDLREDTLNLDERLLEEALTPRTKAVFPVHYGGVACRMDSIMTLARQRGLMVVEDAAQGLGGSFAGQPLGSIGHLAAFSFHATKNVHRGEGGAICVNAPELIERAEILRDKGTNRRQFFRGDVDKYTWVDTGSSYLASELCAAFLLAQLETLDDVTRLRRQIHEAYVQRLQPLEREGYLRLPHIPADCESSYHLFYVLLRDQNQRDDLLDYLRQQRIATAFHFVPLHGSPMGRNFRTYPARLTVTDDAAGRLLRLPFHLGVTEAMQDRVAEAVGEFFHDR